ncbi:MAG: alpha/beta hydrolase [Candidatus Limnocylindrales bacterium]
MKITVRGIPVHYVEEGEGRPVLVLHGLPSHHRAVSDAIEPVFADRPGWCRIYPDLPGMGLTPAGDWISSHQDMVDVVLGFADAVIPGQRFAIMGSSYGGYLALGVIRARPSQLNGVALLTPASGRPSNRRDLPPHVVFEEDPEAVASVGPDEQLWLQVAVVQTAEALARFRTSIKPGFEAADMPFLDRLEASDPGGFDAADLPARITAPTLLLAGRQDSIVGYAEMLSLLETFPRATLAVLDRAGHALAGEQRALFHALVGEWLDRVEETIPSGS